VVAEKNIQVLFKAVAQVAKKHPEVRLLMVGAGDLVTAKKMVSNLSITDKVTFTDRLPYEETRKFYNGANMFVFASTTETQGLVVGEAMLGGLPIAALTSGIQKEFYPKEVAEVAATPEELPEKINYLLENPDRAKSLAHKSKEFALANFSVDVMAEKQIAVLEEVTEKDQVLESKPS
jgi:glycosyltransferase involved in cell wall biosynthesis